MPDRNQRRQLGRMSKRRRSQNSHGHQDVCDHVPKVFPIILVVDVSERSLLPHLWELLGKIVDLDDFGANDQLVVALRESQPSVSRRNGNNQVQRRNATLLRYSTALTHVLVKTTGERLCSRVG